MINNNYEPVRLEDNRLFLLDQRKLPNHMEYLEATTVEDVYDAIKDLAVRGAPAIGVAAGYGVYIAGEERPESKRTHRRIGNRTENFLCSPDRRR